MMMASEKEMAGAMITKATFKNFRGFRDLTLDGLRRINLIVGDNSSGKTALMEGLFLGSAPSPQAALSLRQFRGYAPPQGPMSIPTFLALWEDLFLGFQIENEIEIALSGTETGGDTFRRVLRIGKAKDGTITVPFSPPAEAQVGTPNAAFTNISFEWRAQQGKQPETAATIVPQMTPVGLLMGQAPGNIPSAILPARMGFAPDLAAENFTDLVRNNKKKQFIDKMRELFPGLLDMDAGYEQGHGLLLAHVKGLDRAILASLFSDGFGRIAEILLLIAKVSGGFVLIDEIENGIFFKRYGNVLKAIDAFSREFATQIFLTTHSDGIRYALAENLMSDDENFSVIRCYREENGDTNARIVSGERAKYALESGIELRV